MDPSPNPPEPPPTLTTTTIPADNTANAATSTNANPYNSQSSYVDHLLGTTRIPAPANLPPLSGSSDEYLTCLQTRLRDRQHSSILSLLRPLPDTDVMRYFTLVSMSALRDVSLPSFLSSLPPLSTLPPPLASLSLLCAPAPSSGSDWRDAAITRSSTYTSALSHSSPYKHSADFSHALLLLRCGHGPSAAEHMKESVLPKLERGSRDYVSCVKGIIKCHLSYNDCEGAEAWLGKLGEAGGERRMMEGLVLMRRGEYRKAREAFLGVEPARRGGGEVYDDEGEFWLSLARIPDPDDAELCKTNNLACCDLYLGSLSSPLRSLEGIVGEDPVRNLTGCVAFNLCTMYDLSEDAKGAGVRKRGLEAVSRGIGVGVEEAEFRVG